MANIESVLALSASGLLMLLDPMPGIVLFFVSVALFLLKSEK